ncbi:MAG: PAS domain S-box protein [Bacteroidota bacterium]|nr:PAS domain S-box protein [Bacteroidota bacterium]
MSKKINMSLKKLFQFHLGIQIALGIGLVILTILLFLNQGDLSRSQRFHFDSYQLADELRQSSDDLTRLARTYVATGNEKFERQYWTVLGIRNGKIPRPVNYNRIYWDLITDADQKPRPDGENISLQDLMVKTGITDAELEKLTLGQKYSDELVRTEKIAMNAVKGLFDDGTGNFTVKKQPDRAMAIRLMNDEAYHENKANIMAPIDDFYAMLQERTNRDVEMYSRSSMNLLRSLGLLIFVVMCMFGFSFVGVNRQISIRNKAEESFVRTLSILKSTMESTADGILVVDGKGGIIQFNEKFKDLWKIPEAIIATKDDNAALGFVLDQLKEPEIFLKKVMDLYGAPDEISFDVLELKDGRTFERYSQPQRIGNVVTGRVWSFRDITERKQAEDAFHSERTMLRTVIDNLPDQIFYKDTQGHYILNNRTHLHSMGVKRQEDVLGKTIFDFHPPDIAAQYFADEIEIIKSSMPIVNKEEPYFQHDSEEQRWHLTSKFPLLDDQGVAIGIVGISHDITKRKWLELEQQAVHEITQGVSTTSNLYELLKLIHQSLKTVMYAENCFVALHDQNTGLFSFPYFVDQHDPTPDPVAMDKSCTAYVYRTGKPFLLTQELFDRLVEQNEVELIGTNSPSWIGVPLLTPSRIIGVLVLQHYEEENIYSERDVQFLYSVGSQIALSIERKWAEDELRESEEMFRRLFQESADPILLLNESGFTNCNPSTVSILKYSSKEEFLNKKPWELSPERQPDGMLSSEKAQMMINKAIAEGYNRFEWIHTTSDGSDLPVEVMLTPIQLKGKQFLYTIWRDISERKRTEKERDVMITELQTSLEQIKTLKGIVPICAHCKKIRDDKGYWEQVEAYVSKHSDAQFSHSICPDCRKEHYPEFSKEK